MAIITLTGLDGSTQAVNTEEVFGLSAVPASLLPTGVPAGTYIASDQGSRVAVQGTVAATIAALGGLGSQMSAVIDGATGAVLVANAVITSVRNAQGDYTITHPSFTGASFVSVDGGAHKAYADIADSSATTSDVLVYDETGAAQDPTQICVLFIPLP